MGILKNAKTNQATKVDFVKNIFEILSRMYFQSIIVEFFENSINDHWINKFEIFRNTFQCLFMFQMWIF